MEPENLRHVLLETGNMGTGPDAKRNFEGYGVTRDLGMVEREPRKRIRPAHAHWTDILYARMKLSRVSKSGIVVAGVGVVLFIGTAVWLKSVRTTVADIAVTQTPGTITKDFTVDYDALYTLAIRLDPSVSPDTATCLLGGEKSPLYAGVDCKDTPALLGFSWQLSRDGKVVENGTSAEMGSSSSVSGPLDVTIVSFPARRNHLYTIALAFDKDANQLKIPPPRARVELDIFNKEDFIWAGAWFDSIALALGLVGVTMVLVPVLRARR